ncbi:unnamed protein product, partial [marine sediment metagenome]
MIFRLDVVTWAGGSNSETDPLKSVSLFYLG